MVVDEPFGLDAFETLDGEDAVDGLFSFPEFLPWEGPAREGTSIPDAGLSDLVYAWDPADAAGSYDWYFVIVTLATDRGATIATNICFGDVADGSVAVPPEIWDEGDLFRTGAIFCSFGAIGVRDAALDDGRGRSRTLVLTAQNTIMYYVVE